MTARRRGGSFGLITRPENSSPGLGRRSDQQPSPPETQQAQSRPFSLINRELPILDPEEKAKGLEELVSRGFIQSKDKDEANLDSRKPPLTASECHPLGLTTSQDLDKLEPPRVKQACIHLMAMAHFGPTGVSTIVLDELDKVVPEQWWARAFDSICSKDHSILLQRLLEYFLPVEENGSAKKFKPKLRKLYGTILHTLAEHGLARGYEDLKQAFSPRVMAILRSYFSEPQLLTANDREHIKPLHWALFCGHMALFHSMLDWIPPMLRKEAVNWYDPVRMTLLHSACKMGLSVLVSRLFQDGADINAQHERDKCTPLHMLSQGSRDPQKTSIAQFLCENGADPCSRDNDGATPLHWAAAFNYPMIARCLLSHIQDRREMFRQDCSGRTPLMRTIRRKTKEEFAPWRRNDDWHPFPGICKAYFANITRWLPSVGRRDSSYTVSQILYQENDDAISWKLGPEETRWIHFPANNLEWCDELLARWFIEADGAIDSKALKAARRPFAHQYTVGSRRSFLPSGVQCFYPDHAPNEDSPSFEKGRDIAKKRICFIAAPFIFSETHSILQNMQKILQCPPDTGPIANKSKTLDDFLYTAYAKDPGFHPRRTLNQYAYHNVAARIGYLGSQAGSADATASINPWHESNRRGTRQLEDSREDSPRILDDVGEPTAEQLWIWILGESLVVTCFPERWNHQGSGNTSNRSAFYGTMFSRDAITTRPPDTASDLALRLMTHVFGVRHAYLTTEPEMQLVKKFEQELGRVREHERMLLERFTITYKELKEGKKFLRASGAQVDHDFQFVETLNDLSSETDLLNELRTVREDLNILTMIFEEQERVAEAFVQHQRRLHQEKPSVLTSIFASASATTDNFDEVFEPLKSVIKQGLLEIARLDRKALIISQSLSELVQLKQAHSNAFELGFSRSLSLAAARQSRAVMVFTVITIVFSPLSFVAAFFTMNLSNLPDSIDLSYVSKYIFGFGFAVAIPCIILAFSMSEGRSLWLRAWDLIRDIQLTQPAGKKKIGIATEGANATKAFLERADGGEHATRTDIAAILHQRVSQRLSGMDARVPTLWRRRKSSKAASEPILPR